MNADERRLLLETAIAVAALAEALADGEGLATMTHIRTAVRERIAGPLMEAIKQAERAAVTMSEVTK